jgi:hypothetical protein
MRNSRWDRLAQKTIPNFNTSSTNKQFKQVYKMITRKVKQQRKVIFKVDDNSKNPDLLDSYEQLEYFDKDLYQSLKNSKDIKERRKVLRNRFFNFKLSKEKAKRKNVDDFIQLNFGPKKEVKPLPNINIIDSEKRKSINSYVYRFELTFRFKRKTEHSKDLITKSESNNYLLSIASEFERSSVVSKDRRITFQNKRQKSIFMTFEDLYDSRESKAGDSDSFFK